MIAEQVCDLTFQIVQNGTFEMTPETGVTDNRPTCSILKIPQWHFYIFKQWNILIDIDHPVKDRSDIINSLGSIGVTPKEIHIIILTHLHPDHMGHKDLFPNALFVFHKDENFTFYFKNNRKCELEGSSIWNISDNSQPESIDYIPDLRNLEESIYIRHCPGHTKGSLVVFVCIGGLVQAFVGDIFLNREYYEKWQPPGMSWNQEQIYEHMEFIKDNADVIVPGHGEPFTT